MTVLKAELKSTKTICTSEPKSFVKVLDSPSLTVLNMASVDVKKHRTCPRNEEDPGLCLGLFTELENVLYVGQELRLRQLSEWWEN